MYAATFLGLPQLKPAKAAKAVREKERGHRLHRLYRLPVGAVRKVAGAARGVSWWRRLAVASFERLSTATC
jgi:hypothetical protein